MTTSEALKELQDYVQRCRGEGDVDLRGILYVIKALRERVEKESPTLSDAIGSAPLCNCQERIKSAMQATDPGMEPSGGHDWVDEVLGLLRVAWCQRDTAERKLAKLSNAFWETR